MVAGRCSFRLVEHYPAGLLPGGVFYSTTGFLLS